jgi:hypothetical protein
MVLEQGSEGIELYGAGDFIEVSSRFQNQSVAMPTIGMPDANSWNRKGVVCVLASFNKYKDCAESSVAIGLVGRRECTGSVAWFRDGCFLKGGGKGPAGKERMDSKMHS